MASSSYAVNPLVRALRRTWRSSKPKLLGLGFLAVVGGLLALSILIYNKAFTKVVMVHLQADRIGRQLDANADVKVRGILVGTVRAVHTTGDGATLDLALKPDEVSLIPQDVQARILPKTLFGEKFVDLVIPSGQSAQSAATVSAIRAGDVIPQDRSATAIELGTVFDDLVPLLRTVQPAKLNMTLTSLATALNGRGNALGDNLVKADTYFAGSNPSLPQLDTDISSLADVADTYNAAAPDLLRTLANQVVSQQTLARVGSNGSLHSFLTGTTSFSTELGSVLTTNESDFIGLANVSKPVLDTVRDHGQEIPYVLGNLPKLGPIIDDFLGGQGPYLHILATPAISRGPFNPATDCATYGKASGPACPGGGSYPADPVQGSGTATGNAQTSSYGPEAGWLDPAGTAVETAQLSTVVGPALGVPPASVGALADVLYGPLLRGTTTSLSTMATP